MSPAEVRRYRSLYLWARGRIAPVEPGTSVFASTQGTLVLPAAFGAATVIEIGALHFLIPWDWLRISLAVSAVWSLLAVLGYLALHRVHPHYLTDTQFVLRQSGTVVATLDRADVVSVALRRRYSETSPIVRDSRLFLPNMDGTAVDVALGSTVDVQLPALRSSRRKIERVDCISVSVDDPASLVAALKSAHVT